MEKILLGLLIISCSTFAQTRYALSSSSKLSWHGEDVLGNGHDGTITFLSGNLQAIEKKIARGDFIIDMNSIFSLDPKSGKDIEGLTEHLKSDDFFTVDKFPKSFFTIFSVSQTSGTNQFEVKGFLTIKGIINQITFPALIAIKENQVSVKAEFSFDRTLWNITFQSKNFLQNLKDIALSDEIKIKLDLIFTRNE